MPDHKDASDTYFGRTIHDPYRWLESSSDDRVLHWMQREGEVTRRMLDSVAGVQPARNEVASFFTTADTIENLHVAAGRMFYLRRAAGEIASRLCVRSLGGAEKTLFRFSDDLAPVSTLTLLAPSPEGRYVAFGVSQRGSGENTVELIDTNSGAKTGDKLEHISDLWMSWIPGQAAFYYLRYPDELDPEPAKRHVAPEIAMHVLGTPSSADLVVLSRKHPNSPPMIDGDVPELYRFKGSPYEVSVVFHGASSDRSIYSRPLAGGPWREVVARQDAVASWDVVGRELFVISRRNTPLGVVGRVDLGTSAPLQTMTGSDGRNLVNLTGSKGALFVVDEDFKGTRIRRLDLKTAAATSIPLPFEASVNELVSEPGTSQLFFQIQGWSDSPRWLAARDATLALEDPFPDQARFSVTGTRVEHTIAKSRDGTEVPLTILAREQDAEHRPAPTILQGYGAYEVSLRPAFTSGNAVWLKRGGVLAIAHVRGGGELGREWHVAGTKERKKNSVDDFIACAEQLVNSGVTRPDRLGIAGGSAGGLLVGMAMVQRPELFRAVYIQSGLVNVLRLSTLSIGVTNAEEFGSVSSHDEFLGLLQTDVYQNVRRGVRYPAVLVAVGLNDANVPSWQGAKLVARLHDDGIGGNPVLLRVQPDEGHGGRTLPQQIAIAADTYTFFLWQLHMVDG